MAFQILETEEGKRVEASNQSTEEWWIWGPYLSERQWGTVREDYSPDGSAWDYFPHDHARSRAYRWGEDGIAGISDHHQRLCFALALWNGNDDILKERLFGLTGQEGNHGEDVKEYYFYLDATPTASFMRYLYKYPQARFPYAGLVDETHRRGRGDLEYELIDTGAFDEQRYFDVMVEYAKRAPHDICIRITAFNRGPDSHDLHLLPTMWFRNTWSWNGANDRPELRLGRNGNDHGTIEAGDIGCGTYWLYFRQPAEVLFTENETNFERLYPGKAKNRAVYVKDAFHRYVINGDRGAVNPSRHGTKAAAWYRMDIPAGGSATVELRLSRDGALDEPFGPEFDGVFRTRKEEADAFYRAVCPFALADDLRAIQRQAFAGMLWSKQFYHYVVNTWIEGDPAMPPPPASRAAGRNAKWRHVYCRDIISMPDKWEYDWFAAWDLAFHAIPLAMVDPGFAKRQLYLLCREWYMHPNGQLPAYEWSFDDVNPPVQAWAAYRVYKIEKKMYGREDRDFLERMFQKLLLYFTWWVNRKDDGRNIFQGGFLGLDNISMFNRSNLGIPESELRQADATGWMAMFCLNMLRIAIELGKSQASYRDWAGKFFQHFLLIVKAMNLIGGEENHLWDMRDGFFYDMLRVGNQTRSLKVRSVVGLVPLFAVEEFDLAQVAANDVSGFAGSTGFSDLKEQFDWFLKNSPELTRHPYVNIDKGSDAEGDSGGDVLLSIVDREKLRCVLRYMLDENEFLSPVGIRALSKHHLLHPENVNVGGKDNWIGYEPAESRSEMFGGNSNWRGPVWMPVNYLLIESLQKYHHFLGDDFKVECPTGSGTMMTLWEVSMELSRRLIGIFQRNDQGCRPVYGGTSQFQTDEHWRDLILFYEYFHGDNGAGIGASHQTGWTGLTAKLIQQRAEYPG